MQDLYLNMITGVLAAGRPGKPKANPEIARERGRSVAALNKARKIAAAHGVNIDKDASGGWWVTCSKFPDGQDPMEGNHFACDGREVLDTVETYIVELQKLPAHLVGA